MLGCWRIAAVATAAALLAACGGSVEVDEADPAADSATGTDGDGIDVGKLDAPGEQAAHDAGQDEDAHDAKSEIVLYDAPNDYADPPCPDVVAPQPTILCDIYKPPPGDCPAGEACYRIGQPGPDKCTPSTYIAECLPAGTGTQGAACGQVGDCAGGFECVYIGSTPTCGQLCKLGQPGACPDGMICEGVASLGDEGVCF